MSWGRNTRAILAAIAGMALLNPGAGLGQPPASPLPLPLPPPVETEGGISALAQFLNDNPGCREMTDACQVCVRAAGRIACTTPGIACVKTAWRCAATAPDTPSRPAK